MSGGQHLTETAQTWRRWSGGVCEILVWNRMDGFRLQMCVCVYLWQSLTPGTERGASVLQLDSQTPDWELRPLGMKTQHAQTLSYPTQTWCIESPPLSSIGLPDRLMDCRVEEECSRRAAAIFTAKSLQHNNKVTSQSIKSQLEKACLDLYVKHVAQIFVMLYFPWL